MHVHRLWDELSQDNLANTHVLVFGENTLTSEILKNLVLSGVKRYTFVGSGDDENSKNEYLSGSIQHKTTGFETLQELDESVSVISREDNWHDSKNLDKFDVFIVSSSPIQNMLLVQRVADQLFLKNKLVLDVRTLGQLGYLSCHKMIHLVINSHTHTNTSPLFITNAFPELNCFYKDTWNRYIQSKKSIKIPYPVYLYHYYQEWRKAGMNINTMSWSDDQKENFRSFIHSQVDSDDENYICTYVIPHIHHIWSDNERMHENLQAFSNKLNCKSHSNPVLSILITMIKDDSSLWCTGIVPDMECDTDIFVEFTRIMKHRYETIAKECSKNIYLHIPSTLIDYIEFQIKLYLRHLGELVFLSGEKLQLETSRSELKDSDARTDMNFYKSIYFALRECTRNTSNPLNLYVNEHANDHVIMIDSILGAVAAQEVIKYCTGHYIPLSGNQVLVYQSIDLSKEPFQIIA